MKIKHYICSVLGICWLALSLSACHSKRTESVTHIIVIPEPLTTELYFSGNLLPHHEKSVTAPNEGIIVQQAFHYGQHIHQGQLLFVIDSTKQAADFQTAFSNYLKAKETVTTSMGSFNSTSGLYKQGLVSRDEFTQAKNSYYNDQLAFLQAKNQLQQAVKFYKTDYDVFALSIQDVKKISRQLQSINVLGKINVHATSSGIALFPTTSGQNTSDNHRVTVGSQVKPGQLLLMIGDTEGLKIRVQANQININQLRLHLPAIVTGDAFPQFNLKGYVASIDSQATLDSNGLPAFNMEIVVPHLTAAEKNSIKIGMTAKVAITLVQSKKIVLPLSALFEEQGQAMVEKLVAGKPVAVAVKTGQTTLNSVEVTAGVKPGDKIVARHRAQ